MSQTKELLIRDKWKMAWQSRPFRRQTISGSIILIAIFSIFPFFFQMIEKRNGVVLNDWLLNYLQPHDVSPIIFSLILIITLLACVRMFQQPDVFITMLWAYILLCILRMSTISIIALNPPAGLIKLVDPISNFFYGDSFVTKDLFFSGHTSSTFLIFLCLKKRYDKVFALIGTYIIGVSLMVQHVHYSIDVFAAPLFAYACYLFSKKIIYDYSY